MHFSLTAAGGASTLRPRGEQWGFVVIDGDLRAACHAVVCRHLFLCRRSQGPYRHPAGDASRSIAATTVVPVLSQSRFRWLHRGASARELAADAREDPKIFTR